MDRRAPGWGLKKSENLPAGVLDYILSKDIDGTVKKIQSSGGSIVTPKMEIPGMGFFAVFQDPTGITFALYEPQAAPRRAPAARRKNTKRAAPGGPEAIR